MGTLESLYKGFACPYENLEEGIIDYIVFTHVKEKLLAFGEEYVIGLKDLDSEAYKLFREVTGNIDASYFWTIPLGIIKQEGQLMTDDKVYAVLASSVLSFLFSQKNFPETRRSFRIRPAVKFDVFVRSMYFPEIDSVCLKAAEKQFILEDSSGSRHIFTFDNENWVIDSPLHNGLAHIEQTNTMLEIRFPAYLDFLSRGKQFSDPGQLDKKKAFYTATFSMIGEFAPEYLPWVSRFSKLLLITPGDKERLYSGSNPHWLGVVNLSYPVSKIAAAEMLVHECSHQLYFVSKFLDNHDDGNYEQLFYSPIKNTGRPIWAILIAYHAFANVVLFYRRCQENGLKDRGYCRKNSDILRPQLRQLEDALTRYDAFTSLGNALWKPLSKHLNE